MIDHDISHRVALALPAPPAKGAFPDDAPAREELPAQGSGVDALALTLGVAFGSLMLLSAFLISSC
jgi:hypothetical protein